VQVAVGAVDVVAEVRVVAGGHGVDGGEEVGEARAAGRGHLGDHGVDGGQLRLGGRLQVGHGVVVIAENDWNSRGRGVQVTHDLGQRGAQ
jgi:hypothetical protein